MSLDLINLANVIISGGLTGLVYGLMALGLSVIFGVARVVNFAHGEIMTIAMYHRAVAFALFDVNPSSRWRRWRFCFCFRLLVQSTVIQPFVNRPDHSQFMLLLASQSS